MITDANPPVVRATIVAVVMAFGQLIGRNTSRWNSLALAALLVLAWNPSDLFNAGAQLSFVAVGAILLTTGFLRSVRQAVELDDAKRGPNEIVVVTFRIKKAKAAGIPVILLDRNVDQSLAKAGEDYVTFIGSDFIDEGKRVAAPKLNTYGKGNGRGKALPAQAAGADARLKRQGAPTPAARRQKVS